MSKQVRLYTWPVGEETPATRAWLQAHEINFEEIDGTLAISLMLAQHHEIEEYPMVVVCDGDEVVDVFGGHQPDRLKQLIVSPPL